jgi:hypothetical protein
VASFCEKNRIAALEKAHWLGGRDFLLNLAIVPQPAFHPTALSGKKLLASGSRYWSIALR